MNDIKKTGPKDVFFHLLNIIALYVCVIFFGILLFNYIDIYFPDVLRGAYPQYARGSLRWPVSVLVIVFPLFVWVSAYLQKDLTANPEKRELKTRKWLLYFTLFISTIVIVGDFVTLIYQFLSGGLSAPFLFKILTVFIIAVAVFLYYGWNIKKEIAPSKNPKMKIFVRLAVVLGGLAITFGFYAAGSPQSERLRQFDERKINDLSSIQFQIVDYWQSKEKLPQALDELKNDITGFVPPKDPETGNLYEYKATDKLSFELCAEFKTSDKEEGVSSRQKIPEPAGLAGFNENWQHDTGHVCFSRTIDPDRFPPRKTLKQ